jgi:hypothetical protein
MLMFDWMYVLVVLVPGLIMSGAASWLVRTRFNHYSQVGTLRGLTGAQAAKILLDRAGIHDVDIVPVEGFLSDHYDPINKRLALSPPVYNSQSVAAIGVATHEAGHAIQHATGYLPLKMRSALVPAVQFGSPLAEVGMVLGLAIWGGAGSAGGGGSMLGQGIFLLGVGLFALLVLFQLITLPVEFDASNRAKSLVVESGIISPAEREGVDKVLGAAALTYVAAFVTSLLTLLYFLYRAGLLGGRSDE